VSSASGALAEQSRHIVRRVIHCPPRGGSSVDDEVGVRPAAGERAVISTSAQQRPPAREGYALLAARPLVAGAGS